MKQIQAAFSTSLPMLKGGLHCHTNRSDGAMNPADVIRLHKEHGYDFLAITDHRRYNFKNFAPETGVLIIPGMEMDRIIDTEIGLCFHTVCIGPAKEDGNGFEQDEFIKPGKVKNQFEYQPYLDEIRERKNLSIYCHPDYSCTPYTSFDHMEGIFAMEIWNSSSAICYGMDTNAYCWDDVLRMGKRLWGIASDDGHKPSEHCNGWVRVAAEKNLHAILIALQEGKFYSSCGPEIYDFYVEDDRVTVCCSDASSIRFIFGNRPSKLLKGKNLTEFTVELPNVLIPEISRHVPYVRAEITDSDGHMAWTNPIFFDV